MQATRQSRGKWKVCLLSSCTRLEYTDDITFVAKGLGVPSSTGVQHDTAVFKDAPVRNDDLDKLPEEASVDSVTRVSSKVGPGASIEITRDAFVRWHTKPLRI